MATCRPCRLTSFADESWYYGSISDVETRTVLLGSKMNGQFLVRDVVCPTDDFQYMLTVRNANEIRSYPVTVCIDGQCTLKGSTFPSLEAAVDFFSENMLDGVHLVTGNPPPKSSPDLGPDIQVIRDESGDIANDDVFLGDDLEETDFSMPMKQAEVTVEITPHHILESQDGQCESNRLDSTTPTAGSLIPPSQDDSMLAPPTVTYSTFKPARSPSPDVVSPSPATSLNSSFSAMNSSLLAIWPTRQSFHESRASMSNAESDSSGEEDDDSDTDVVSDGLDDDATVSNTASNEVSQSTLAASQPCSCVGDLSSNMGGVSAISDNEATPIAVPAQPRVCQSKYARRNQSAAAQPKASPSLSVREVSPTVAKPSLPVKYSKSEPSILELQHTLEEKLSLKYENKQGEQKKLTGMPKPIPCEFYQDCEDSFGSQPYLYTPLSNRHSFVFPSSQTGSLHQRHRPPSTRGSNQKQRPQSACLTLPQPESRGRQRSIRRRMPSLSSLFHKLFKKKSSSAPSQPAQERQGTVSHGTAPLRHQMAEEMQAKYSSITRHNWESDSMVVLPGRKGASHKA